MPLTVGTAGHIDHGKTWLVRALTGKDTDRLPEEQARGISIDLGYAPLDLPDGRRLSLIDVPGHERFVRNMVAGASGIDLFLLVVDAGEGARPQTLEHLAIVRLLGIEHGVVAITKADAVEPELVELVAEEARELVPGVEVVVHEREDRARARRAPRALSGRRRTAWPRSAPRARRGSSSTASSPCAESGRWRPERSGRDRSARETCCAPSRPGSTCAFAAFRCTTGRSNEPKPGSASRSRFRESSAETFAEATRSSHRVPTPLPTASTSRSTSSRRSRTGCACTSTTGRPSTTPGSSASESAGRSSASLRPRWRRAATASSSATGRPWAAALVLDPAPPRHASPARFELLERGDLAALVHEPVRADALSAPRRRDERPRARRRVGLLRRMARGAACRSAGADRGRRPARPRDPGSRRAMGQGRAPARRRRAAGRAPLPSGRGGEPRRALGGRRGAGGGARRSRLHADRPSDDRELASFLEREGRLVRLGDGLALGTAAYEEAKRLMVEECEQRGLDHPCALPRPARRRAASRPSSSSSASTRTASRGASATSACCAAGPRPPELR